MSRDQTGSIKNRRLLNWGPPGLRCDAAYPPNTVAATCVDSASFPVRRWLGIVAVCNPAVERDQIISLSLDGTLYLACKSRLSLPSGIRRGRIPRSEPAAGVHR